MGMNVKNAQSRVVLVLVVRAVNIARHSTGEHIVKTVAMFANTVVVISPVVAQMDALQATFWIRLQVIVTVNNVQPTVLHALVYIPVRVV